MITAVLILIIILLTSVLLIMRHKHIKMLDRLDFMLDSATENKFSETEFTESRLSKTETKMYRYLSAGKTSLAQITSEKDAVKSLISDISHQTKTPISNILLYSELLCDNAKLNDDTKKLAEYIKAQTEKLNFLIGSLEMFVKIDIKDNGIGICEEDYPKIFTRFYRSQKVSGEQGVGIGLYLAREIISRQGGYIKVESTENKGSEFSVFIPQNANMSKL